MIAKKIGFCLMSMGMFAIAGLTSCGVSGPAPEPRVSKPLVSDLNEVHWRMYYEDQFDAYSLATPPSAGDPDVAWTAYYSEKNSYAIRENNKLLKEQLRLQKKEDKERKD